MSILLLSLLALAPPAAFLVYILRHDRAEPEPPGFVVRMLLSGVVAVIPAAIAEGVLLESGLFPDGGLLRAGLQSFLVIAPAEELVKFLAVLLFAWKSRNFNEPNDGIVYSAAVSIGFAMAENLLYVLEHGLGTGIARALTAIPGHAFTGVLMGRCIGAARFSPRQGRRTGLLMAGLALAWFFHGLYDTFVLSGTGWALMVIPMVVLYFVLGIRFLRKGREGSIRRWGPDGTSPAPAVPQATPRRAGFRRVSARVLLTLSGVFWLLIVAGVIHDILTGSGDSGYAVLGGVVITVIPITAGVLLEVSARRREKRGESGS